MVKQFEYYNDIKKEAKAKRRMYYITLPIATNFASAFGLCSSLETIGTINTPSVTSLSTTFNVCAKLKSIIFTECSGVTNTTNTFNACPALEEVIMPNLTRGVVLSTCSIDTAELDAFFTSLGTASGSQTITITGNPGAATCDASIATGKGFTVTG